MPERNMSKQALIRLYLFTSMVSSEISECPICCHMLLGYDNVAFSLNIQNCFSYFSGIFDCISTITLDKHQFLVYSHFQATFNCHLGETGTKIIGSLLL